MIYVFDTSSFVVLKHYFPSRFPKLWTGLEDLVESHRLVSVREVLGELEAYNETSHVKDWAKKHADIFPIPEGHELGFVAEIFKVPHFRMLISNKKLLSGRPVADPFVIAAAKARDGGCVVTQESGKKDSARIPNVCEHFKIACLSLEGFMQEEGWAF